MMLALASVLLAPNGYQLVFQDEFDVDGRPDTKKWTYEMGFVRNRELQWYQRNNARVENGLLVIEGRRERVKNPGYDASAVKGAPNMSHEAWRKTQEYAEYTSSSIKTRGLHSWCYGRFEVKARIIPKQGLWPAIWTLGDVGRWPLNGEIDILEFYQQHLHANTVYGKGQWDSAKVPIKEFLDQDPEWGSKFHIWRMDWDAKAIKLYLDDRLMNETDITKTLNPDGFNPFRQKHHVLLNLAIGSTGGDPSKVEFPTKYEVDYVRIYQKS